REAGQPMIFDIANGAQAILEYLDMPGIPRWAAQVLGVTPGARMVVQYAVYDRHDYKGCEPLLTLIGKFYADTTGQQAYRVMREITYSLAQASPPALLALPEVLFYDPQHRFMAQQRIEGAPYYELLKRADCPSYFRLAGQALATLHTQNVAVGQAR